MNRYQIAIGRGTKPLSYLFKTSMSVNRIADYMKRCVKDGVMMETVNLQNALVDSAVVNVSKELRVPIVVSSDKVARSLSISQNHRKIYTIESLPSNQLFVICYWDVNPSDLPEEVTSMLTIRKKVEECVT